MGAGVRAERWAAVPASLVTELVSVSDCLLLTARPKFGERPRRSGERTLAHRRVRSLGGVRERRGGLAADDRGGLVNEFVVVESLHHEKGEVDAARDVALENGITHVPAPHGQALTLALLKVAAAYDGPPRVAGEDPPGRLHLVIEIGEASEPRERAEKPSRAS